MRNVYLATFLGCVLLVSILGFRGTPFTKPPADVFPEWLFPGMKYQPKLRPQSESHFFADGRADRMPPTPSCEVCWRTMIFSIAAGARMVNSPADSRRG